MYGEDQKQIEDLRSKIQCYDDFPKPGIRYLDIFSALTSGPTCTTLHNLMVRALRAQYPTVQALVALESRGFIFGFALSAELGLPFVPVRKRGKLPGEVVAYKYQLEYGEDVVEIQISAITPGLRCVIVDDLIATGGSLGASVSLLRQCGGEVLGALVVMELTKLNGRDKCNIPVLSLLKYDL